MLQNEWTTRDRWTAHGVKNIRTEFTNAANPRSREAANMKFLQNANNLQFTSCCHVL